jgi:peroxiredoxin
MRNTLDAMSPTNASESYSYAVRAVYYVAEQVEKSEGAQAALDLINGAEGKINYSQFQSKEEKQRADSTISLFAGKRADLLTTIGKKDEALQALETAVARLTPDNKQAQSSLLAKKTQIQITGSPAPALAVERGHGEFKGLNAYKGKVILIDFFAHWCGPCIRSFPAMKKMYADLHSKGLEIFGVTTYYGYYKQEKPLDHDAEFAKMKDFIGEHGLPWAVLYGERTNFQAYGVSGIPHVVLIDKAGNVNYIKIGYSEEGLTHLREKIEALLNDKARNTSEQ